MVNASPWIPIRAKSSFSVRARIGYGGVLTGEQFWQKVAGFPNIQIASRIGDGPRRRPWFRQDPVGIVCVLF